MATYSKADAIQKMNTMGGAHEPFLFVVSFDTKETRIWTPDDLPHNVHMSFEGKEFNPLAPHALDTISLGIDPVPFDTYKDYYTCVMDEILYGNTFLINLTVPTPIDLSHGLRELYAHSMARYKVCIDDEFLVFSPEIFIKIEEGKIRTYPMKGTIDADLPRAKEILLADKKEAAEHFTIVDLLRNDLSMVAKNVHVKRFKYIEKLSTSRKELYQMSSEIEGTLPENYTSHIGDILYTLLPAGSISGAPKKRTVEIINGCEPDNRGFYTGIVGYFDGYSLDTGVMIRFIQKKEDGSLVYRSGGGITSMSNLDTEYKELQDKIYIPH